MKQLPLFVLLVPVIVAIAASSTSWSQSATEPQACSESCGSMPKVGAADSASNPEMQRLARAFLGTWSTSESFAHNEFYPNGAERKGSARFSLATGGTSLIEEVHSDGSAGRLDFMVVIWWDNEAKVYNFFTCGNGGNNPCKIRGTAHWDGDSFVNGYELTIRGAKKRWKDTFSEITPKSFTLVAAMESMNGNAMQPMITTQYTVAPSRTEAAAADRQEELVQLAQRRFKAFFEGDQERLRRAGCQRRGVRLLERPDAEL